MRNAIRNGYAKTLRDIADGDYISARVLYKNHCFDQFLYFSHQCLEKYCKATLLFNDVKLSKNLGHDLNSILIKLDEISVFDISKDARDFINKLNDTYFSRYLSAPFYARRNYLNLLDLSVWQIRIFAQSDVDKIMNLKRLHKTGPKLCIKTNAISHGLLEKIYVNRDKKEDVRRRYLIWKNPFYGLRRLSEDEAWGFWSKSPVFFNDDNKWQVECYNYLRDYVRFEHEVHKYFKDLINQ